MDQGRIYVPEWTNGPRGAMYFFSNLMKIKLFPRKN